VAEVKGFDLGIRADYFLNVSSQKVSVERNRFIGIKGNQIEEVTSAKASQKKDCKRYWDLGGRIVMPGMVNGHVHLPMTLFRGLEDDVSFHTWLFERILPLEAELVSPAFVRDGVELAAWESIRFGVTTLNEMYFFIEEALRVLDRVGLRAIVSQPLAMFPLPEDKLVGLDKFAHVLKMRKRYGLHPRLEVGLGPHAPYSCDDAQLKKVGEMARELGMPIHIHVAETAREVEEHISKHKESPLSRLERLGVLRPRTICAHMVHLSEADRSLLKKSGASVVYNPDSNAKLGSGIAPICDYLKRSIPVGLGTDGAASNNDLSLFGAMDLGAKLQKLAAGDPSAYKAESALYSATLGGATALGWQDRIGSIEAGKRADLVVMDLNQPHLNPRNDLVSHLVYAAQGLEVTSVIVDGKVLMEDRNMKTVDPSAISRKAERWRSQIQKALARLREK
jgi:5-methylthioadenosine/S-adenosylhomocysteine deaminase